MQIKLVFTRNVLHLASFWKWEFLEYGNGLYVTCTSHIMTLFVPLPPPPILHNLCFSFPLGITGVPREIENNAYAIFRGVNKVHYGRSVSEVFIFCKVGIEVIALLKLSIIKRTKKLIDDQLALSYHCLKLHCSYLRSWSNIWITLPQTKNTLIWFRLC